MAEACWSFRHTWMICYQQINRTAKHRRSLACDDFTVAAASLELSTSPHTSLSTYTSYSSLDLVSSHGAVSLCRDSFVSTFVFILSYCICVVLLSAQCISSIGQIIKSVCVSVSQSVTQNELNALQIAIFHRSSPNLPPR